MTTETIERQGRTGAETGKESYAGVLDTNGRYEIIGELGRGTWGVVYKAKDKVLDKEFAIKVLEPSENAKEQMEERGLDNLRAMQNEWALAPCAHVVPRSWQIDNAGRPYVVMPIYEHFLEGALNDKANPDKRISVRSGLPLEKAIGIMTDTANGLEEMHEKMGRVHGDLKPDNIALDKDGRALISDLGTSTCASFFGRSDSPRSNMGCVNTRAYECFDDKNGHPSKGSDAYAWAALAFRIFSGKYPWEDEIANLSAPGQYFARLGEENVNAIVKEKVRKNVPRKFRKIIERGLRFSPYQRQSDGNALHSELSEVVDNLNFADRLKKDFRKWTVKVGLPAVLLAGIIYTGATHEPTRLDMPEKPRINGMLYRDDRALKEGERIEFESEKIDDLPPAEIGLMNAGQSKIAKQTTDNRVVAYLVKCKGQALLSGGTWTSRVNDYQQRMYFALTSPEERKLAEMRNRSRVHPIWAKVIEYALYESKKDGKVDLEDTMAISRVGTAAVAEAKRVSGSQDYEKYRGAKNAKGDLIIPKRERELIDLWLAYYHADFD